MVIHHRKGFFGKNTGVLFDRGTSNRPTNFFTFIKKKEDGSWEKPTQKEGRAIKFSLVDIAYILQVLCGGKNAWNTVHSFGEREISIAFERDTKDKDKIKVTAGDYVKLLNYGETEVFKALLDHTFQEKVIASTEVKKREPVTEIKYETVETNAEKTSEEEVKSVLVETAILAGVCKGETGKALLIAFEGKKEIWVPKSAILSSFDPKITVSQKFEIDTWILKKNNLV